ncbi:MAG: ATP-dependent DNA helicase RecG [Rickettsiales bacterium]|jgi:ATP-dependent DNA helicase RecG
MCPLLLRPQQIIRLSKRAQDDAHYIQLITDYLQKFGQASRSDIDGLLKKYLSEALNEDQKIKKISNLLLKMRESGSIYNSGIRSKTVWRLHNK